MAPAENEPDSHELSKKESEQPAMNAKDKFNNSEELTANQLHALLEATRLINSTLKLDNLLQIIVEEINRNLGADRTTLFLIDGAHNELWSKVLLGDESLEIRLPIGKGIAGFVAKTGEIINIPDAYQDSRFNPEVDKRSGYRTRSVLCVPVRDRGNTIIGVVQCLNKKEGLFEAADIRFLNALAEHIAIATENARLYQEALERKKLEDEISLAGEIQQHLLPSHIPDIRCYQIFAHHRPSKQIGGDYYDFFVNGNELALVLADVSGKGVPAALLMANLHAICHTIANEQIDLMSMINKINQHLFLFTAADKYATLFYGKLDCKQHRLNYVNCGHIPPLLFRNSSNGLNVIELEEGGIPLGMLEEFEFQKGSVHLQTGDVLVICSDGITEAMNSRGKMFGIDRATQWVSRHLAKSPRQIGELLLSKVYGFASEAKYQDDITLLILKKVE